MIRHSKYNAIRTAVDGIKFDSKAEATRYSELKLLERAGIIQTLELQPEYMLHAGIKYRADFRYVTDGVTVVEDVKGFETKEFRLKARMFRELYPDIDFRIVKM